MSADYSTSSRFSCFINVGNSVNDVIGSSYFLYSCKWVTRSSSFMDIIQFDVFFHFLPKALSSLISLQTLMLFHVNIQKNSSLTIYRPVVLTTYDFLFFLFICSSLILSSTFINNHRLFFGASWFQSISSTMVTNRSLDLINTQLPSTVESTLLTQRSMTE